MGSPSRMQRNAEDGPEAGRPAALVEGVFRVGQDVGDLDRAPLEGQRRPTAVPRSGRKGRLLMMARTSDPGYAMR